MERRVVITGMGVLSPVGNDVETFWKSLVAGQSGIGLIEAFDTSDYTCKIGGEVKDFDAKQFFKSPKDARRADRFAQLAMAASKMALEDCGVDLETVVVDASTGRVVLSSATPQRLGAPLGSPTDMRFVGLERLRVSGGVRTLGGSRVAFRRRREGAGAGLPGTWHEQLERRVDVGLVAMDLRQERAQRRQALALLVDHCAESGRARRGVALSIATGSLPEKVALSHGLAVTRHAIGFKHFRDPLVTGQADLAGEGPLLHRDAAEANQL